MLRFVPLTEWCHVARRHLGGRAGPEAIWANAVCQARQNTAHYLCMWLVLLVASAEVVVQPIVHSQAARVLLGQRIPAKALIVDAKAY